MRLEAEKASKEEERKWDFFVVSSPNMSKVTNETKEALGDVGCTGGRGNRASAV